VIDVFRISSAKLSFLASIQSVGCTTQWSSNLSMLQTALRYFLIVNVLQNRTLTKIVAVLPIRKFRTKVDVSFGGNIEIFTAY
jgi:hypothetical protein